MTRAWTPTTDLCDADGRARVLAPIFRSYGRLQRFCGEISTLRVDGHNPLVREALHTPGRGRVLVVDGASRLDCALLGDQLAQADVAQGWAGVVVNGAVRDAARLAELPLGVLALATHPRRSGKLAQGERDVGVHFAGVWLWPGDGLCADEDGVVVLPGDGGPPDHL